MTRYPWGSLHEYFWEASLTGDLICGVCGKTMIVSPGKKLSPGTIPCGACKRDVELKEEVIALADTRARSAFPKGRPTEEGLRWKGD